MAKIEYMALVEKEVKWVKICIPISDETKEKLHKAHGKEYEQQICFFVDVDTGKIRNYPENCEFNLFEKVVDRGCYWLLDDKFQVILSIENDYVPNRLIPGSYGNYVNLHIDNAGIIINWPRKADFNDFIPEEDRNY